MNNARGKDKSRSRIAITMGDAAGIGPELIARAWTDRRLHDLCQPIVVGNATVLARCLAAEQASVKTVRVNDEVTVEVPANQMPIWDPSLVDVSDVRLGRVDARCGRAAYDYLIAAVDWAMAGRVDAIVTMPLNKEGLHAAGLDYPGHTEILAERTKSRSFGMMLYRRGLAVLHATLHMSLRSALDALTTARILETIQLLHTMLGRMGTARPRIAVAAINPHASDGGLFGNEEKTLIQPAVLEARSRGIDATGPLPADTLFVRANQGEFDGVAAMYHDQGHIALKLLGWREAVNITVGLPIVRTSVAHGTAYDIAGQGKADPTSLFEAVAVAARLAHASNLDQDV